MNIRKRQTLSLFLSFIGATGLIGTVILTRNNSKKEYEFRNKNLDKKVSFSDYLKFYSTSLLLGTVTISSIVSSTIISRKTEASLVGMAMIADNGWRRYKHHVKRYLGTDDHLKVIQSIASGHKIDKDILQDDGRKLYFEEHIGFFLADPEKLAYAYGDMNQRIHILDHGVSAFYTMLYDLIERSGAEILNKDLSLEALQWGWSYDYLMEVSDYAWIHWFFKDDVTSDGVPYTIIEWGEEPVLNPGNYGEYFINNYEAPEDTVFSPVDISKKDGGK